MPLYYENIPGPDLIACGYNIAVQSGNINPVDALTYYFGQIPKVPVTAADQNKVCVRVDAAIRIANIYCYASGAGSNENISLYIRKNNTADTLIATVGAATSERLFSNTGLNITMAAGDYFELKMVCPTWATNPTTLGFGGYLYFE